MRLKIDLLIRLNIMKKIKNKNTYSKKRIKIISFKNKNFKKKKIVL